MNSKNENNRNIRFTDYQEFIYLNSHMTEEEARAYAVEAWNKGLSKYEALERIEERRSR